jgi:threonine synthase
MYYACIGFLSFLFLLIDLFLNQELFHGPTFAFKDVALQMLGNFFEYFLSTGSNGGRLAVLGATSGDTGSAAIYGLRNKKGIDCVILFPRGRVSEIQQLQMTTVSDPNIHCVAIDGTFDDCQDLVKKAFNDKSYRDRMKLGAVNSINWCRVLAQTTYYFWSWLRMTDNDGNDDNGTNDTTKPTQRLVSFSVPTGNFGDILAGYYAKRMGLPVDKLIVATNENDILYRFFTRGEYHRYDISETISPSMDICVSSNFERYLYHLAGDDPVTLASWMSAFESTGKLTITGKKLELARQDFLSARVDTAQTLDTIKTYYNEHKYMLCPHSAVGVCAVHQLKLLLTHHPTTTTTITVDEGKTDNNGNSSAKNNCDDDLNQSRCNKVVCLATAHFAKFPDACKRAVDPLPPSPPELTKLFNMQTRSSNCPNDLRIVQQFVEHRIRERKYHTRTGRDSRKLFLVAVAGAAVGAIVAMKALRRTK